CHRVGRLPISTIGLGFTVVSSWSRVPNPPARIATRIGHPCRTGGKQAVVCWQGDRASQFVFCPRLVASSPTKRGLAGSNRLIACRTAGGIVLKGQWGVNAD